MEGADDFFDGFDFPDLQSRCVEFRKPLPGSWVDLVIVGAGLRYDRLDRVELVLEADLVSETYGARAYPYKIRLRSFPEVDLDSLYGLEIKGLVRHYRSMIDGRVRDTIDQLDWSLGAFLVDRSPYIRQYGVLLPL